MEKIHYQWTAGEVCFDCPCGVKEFILSEGGDKKTCRECGRVFTLVHYVRVEHEGLTQPTTLKHSDEEKEKEKEKT